MIYELREENSQLKQRVESLKFAENILRKQETIQMAEEDNLMQSIEIEVRFLFFIFNYLGFEKNIRWYE